MPTLGCVYAPHVVVFRASETRKYVFLKEPFLVSVVAAALRNCDGAAAEFLQKKAESIIQTAVKFGHRRLVLGAWFGVCKRACINWGRRADDIVLPIVSYNTINFRSIIL